MLISVACIGVFFATCTSLSSRRTQEPLSTDLRQSTAIHVRNATISDVDDITHVILDAFSSDPSFDYEYQFRKQYPDYHFQCARQTLRQAFENKPDNIVIKVIDVPLRKQAEEVSSAAIVSKPGAEVDLYPLGIVALAIWVFNVTTEDHVLAESREAWDSLLSLSPSFSRATLDCSAHLDANMTRVNNSAAQFQAAKYKYIDTAYDSQLYLALLATHPTWQNQGFGPANLAWGTKEATNLQVPITLIATPAGYPVYVETGFDSVANITIDRVDGDEGDSFWEEVMQWKPPVDQS